MSQLFYFFILVSQLYLCSTKCLYFLIFSIVMSQLYFCSIKCLNFLFFYFGVLTLSLFIFCKMNKKYSACLVHCFVKPSSRIVFENIENMILVFFENCSYSLNLMFYVFFIIKKTRNQKVFPYYFLKQKTVFKPYLKTCLFIVF